MYVLVLINNRRTCMVWKTLLSVLCCADVASSDLYVLYSIIIQG